MSRPQRGKSRAKAKEPKRRSPAAASPLPAELAEQLARRGVPPSYFHGQSFQSELIRQFFAAAIAFRKREPWVLLDAEESIDLDAPSLGITDGYVSVITDDGYGGLHIFFGGGEPTLLNAPDGEHSFRRGLGVMFYPRRQLPDMVRAELRRLPFAPATGPIPVLVAFDDDGRSRPLLRHDYVTAIAALRAITEFATEHEDELMELEWTEPMAGIYAVPVDGDVIEIHLGFDLEDEDAPGVGIAGSGPRPSPNSTHRIRVALRDASPPIWRRLDVPSTITLAELHTVLQLAMGWEDEHLHVFRHRGRDIGPLFDSHVFDERSTELWAVAPMAGATLTYLYDFGDDWVHDIEVERVYEAEVPCEVPACVDGRRAGPPEDCGGIFGLQALLEGGPDIEDEEYEEEDEDVPPYDPTRFSVEEVNAALTRAFGQRPPRLRASSG